VVDDDLRVHRHNAEARRRAMIHTSSHTLHGLQCALTAVMTPSILLIVHPHRTELPLHPAPFLNAPPRAVAQLLVPVQVLFVLSPDDTRPLGTIRNACQIQLLARLQIEFGIGAWWRDPQAQRDA
jgi:hypothetical protein